jgi:hypothetical protein
MPRLPGEAQRARDAQVNGMFLAGDSYRRIGACVDLSVADVHDAVYRMMARDVRSSTGARF